MKNAIIATTLALAAGCATSNCCYTSRTSCKCADAACACTKPCACNAAPNTLSEDEKADGWKLLWDGKSLDGWVSGRPSTPEYLKAPPPKGWQVKDGVLTVLPCRYITENRKSMPLPEAEAAKGRGGDIVTAKKYSDFALKLDFKLTRAANSGIKYFWNEGVNNNTTLEYQILHQDHPDSTNGRNYNRCVAALYDMIPAHAHARILRPNDWNTALIVCKGMHVEHWLNGVKVVEFERGGDKWNEAFKLSKYSDPKTNLDGKWGLSKSGRILLQDHSDSTVHFRNIKIKEL